MNNIFFKLGSAFLIMTLLILSCASKEKISMEDIVMPESSVNSLSEDQIDVQTVWKLVKINGAAATEAFDKIPTLKFDKVEKRIGGTAGCNQYNSVYVLVEDSFTLSKARVTRMMCPFKNDEAGFLRTIEEVNSAEMTDSSLLLKKDGVVTLEFTK